MKKKGGIFLSLILVVVFLVYGFIFRSIDEFQQVQFSLDKSYYKKDNTINICNLTALGKLLRSFLESSNIIFALSIIKAFNLSIIFDLYLL